MSKAYAFVEKKPGFYEVRFELVRNGFSDIKEVCNFIKTVVASSNREYNPLTKTWTIDESCWVLIENAIKLKFRIKDITPVAKLTDENFFYDPTPAYAAQTKESVSVQLERFLNISLINASKEELKKAYRRKALELHPDRNNGDGSKMSELNSLWSVYNNG